MRVLDLIKFLCFKPPHWVHLLCFAQIKLFGKKQQLKLSGSQQISSTARAAISDEVPVGE